jgi:hypothetical protein
MPAAATRNQGKSMFVKEVLDDHPHASLGVGIAPEHLLGAPLEAGIQPGGPPVARAMGLQGDVVEDPPDRPGADGRHDAVGDGLIGQVFTGPGSDVQPPGHGLRARQRDDLGALEGGEIETGRPARPARPSASSPAKPSRR